MDKRESSAGGGGFFCALCRLGRGIRTGRGFVYNFLLNSLADGARMDYNTLSARWRCGPLAEWFVIRNILAIASE